MPTEATVLRRRRQFAVHLLVYALANAVGVLAWLVLGLVTGDWFPWPVVSLAVWGGVVLHLHAWWAYGGRSRLVSEETLVPRPPTSERA